MSLLVTITNPKPGTLFLNSNSRLALYNMARTPSDYWQAYWLDQGHLTQLITSGLQGDLGEFEIPFLKYLPAQASILDAGCGPGHIVAALNSHGYRALGVDLDEKVIKFTKQNFPQLDIRTGDVLNLDFPATNFDSYVSLGIIEHFQEGPTAALKEARRVIRLGGIAFFSVPYLNPARIRLLHSLPESTEAESGFSFHQYYFSKEEFTFMLSQNGLELLDFLPYALEAFLTREIPYLARFWNSKGLPSRAKTTLRKLLVCAPRWARLRFGHMALYVCRAI